MSKIALKPNESGTGVFTLAAPDSNADRTLTLPDEAGSVLTDVSDIEPQVKTATNATGSAPVFACRAWVNFDGTGTVSIRDSGNVSSITDEATGNYTVNFSTAMPDANFCVSGTQSGASMENPGVEVNIQSSSVADVRTKNFSNNTQTDAQDVYVAVFR